MLRLSILDRRLHISNAQPPKGSTFEKSKIFQASSPWTNFTSIFHSEDPYVTSKYYLPLHSNGSKVSGTWFENRLKTSRKSEIFLTLEVVTSKMSKTIPNMILSLLDAFKRDEQEQRKKGSLRGPQLTYLQFSIGFRTMSY